MTHFRCLGQNFRLFFFRLHWLSTTFFSRTWYNSYGMRIIMVCVTTKCELLWYVLLQKSSDLSIMICVNTPIMICVTIIICVFPSTHIGDMCVMFCLPHVVCAWKFLLMKCVQTFHKSNHTIMISVTHFIICATHIMKCIAQIIVVWYNLTICYFFTYLEQ